MKTTIETNLVYSEDGTYKVIPNVKVEGDNAPEAIAEKYLKVIEMITKKKEEEKDATD